MEVLHVDPVHNYDENFGCKYFVTLICDTKISINDSILFSQSAFTIKIDDKLIYSVPVFKIKDIKIVLKSGRLVSKKKVKPGDNVIITVVSDVPTSIDIHSPVSRLLYQEKEKHTYTIKNYTLPQRYNIPQGPYDRKKWEDKKAMNEYKKTHSTVNEYSGEKFDKNSRIHIDHTCPLKTKVDDFARSKKAQYISHEKLKKILNSPDNFSATDSHTNQSKKDLSNKEYVKRENLTATDPKKAKNMLIREVKAEKSINKRVNREFAKAITNTIGENLAESVTSNIVSEVFSQYDQVKNGKKTNKQAIKDGLKNIGMETFADTTETAVNIVVDYIIG